MKSTNFKIDNLQYCNWTNEIFKINNEAKLNTIHVTIAYHEDFQEVQKNIDKQANPLANEINIEFLENKNSFSEQDWKELHKLSEETFVEESESSRSNAASAGLTDND